MDSESIADEAEGHEGERNTNYYCFSKIKLNPFLMLLVGYNI